MKYRLTGNYGTFTITRVVDVEDADKAADLIDAGWSVVSSPDGEEWEIEELGDEA
jgi:hypothetical protein